MPESQFDSSSSSSSSQSSSTQEFEKHSSSRSSAELLRLHHRWTIEHFRHRSYETSLLSNTFKIKQYEFQLKIYPRQTEHVNVHVGDADDTDEHMAVFLWCIGPPYPRAGVDVHFHVVNQTNAAHSISDFKFPRPHIFTRTNPSKGYWQVCQSSYILEPAGGFLGPNGELTVTVDIEFLSDPEEPREPFSLSSSTLENDLRKILDSGVHTDFEIRGSGYCKNVHKVILAARSDYFRAMFSQEMKESLDNYVEITDVSEEIMDAMIAYVYHNKPPDEKSAGDLLVVADRFQMIELVRMCQNILFRHLSVESASDIARLIDRYPQCKELQTLVVGFMVRNIDEILVRQEFKRVLSDCPSLAVRIWQASRASKSSSAVDKKHSAGFLVDRSSNKRKRSEL